jgi:uncharacterized surface protein with fasciclin (FAS1) repeats
LEPGSKNPPLRFAFAPLIAITRGSKQSASASSNPARTSYYQLQGKSQIEERKNEMKKIAQMFVITLVAASAILAAKNPMVGGHEMFPSRNIVQNALNSDDHTTLVAAVKAAGLLDTLEGPGPFTVFAPTNAAFAKLPAGTVDTLLMTENKATLAKILTYHVVSGRMDAKDIARAIKTGNGKAELTTVSGGKLWASMQGKDLVLTDEKGGVAKVTISNVTQSNGVIHVIDTVLLPN